MNYAELVTYIEDFSENTFETSVTNELIRLAEQRINNAVQLPAFRKNVTGTLTDGSPYLALPTDFLSSFSLAVISGTGTYTYLLNKDVNFIIRSSRLELSLKSPQIFFTHFKHEHRLPLISIL